MSNNTNEVIKPDSVSIQPGTYRMRQENRRYMWRQARRAVKYTLMAAGAVAIYNTVTSNNHDHEDC